MAFNKKALLVPALAAGLFSAGLLVSSPASAWHGGPDCYGPRGDYNCPGPRGHGWHRGWDLGDRDWDGPRWHRGWHHRGNCPWFLDDDRPGDPRWDRGDWGPRGPRDFDGPRDPRGPKDFAGPRAPRDIDGPALSPEQRKVYDQLVADFNAKADPLRDQLFVKRAALNTLENSTSADPAAVEKVAREYLELRHQLRGLHDKLVRDMAAAGLYKPMD